MKTSLLRLGISIAALGLALVGCNNSIVDGRNNGHTHDGVVGNDPIEAANPSPPDDCGSPIDPATMTALAIRVGDIPPIGGDAGSSTSSGGGENPDDVMLVISDQVQSCASPYGPSSGCVTQWQIFATVPAGQLVQGTTLDLVSAGFFAESEDDGSGSGVCSGGGGSINAGTLTIDEVDPFMVMGHIDNLSTFSSMNVPASITFDAGRCESIN